MRPPRGLAAAMVAAFAVHGMALRSDFIDDDFLYVYELDKLGTLPSLLYPFGHHFMASFKLVVAVLHGLFGLDPRGYFALVLATHLANVCLLYGIVRALSRSGAMATVVALLWGTAPVFQSTLAWFSAYSHMLSTTTTLAALWELARAVRAGRPPTALALVRINVLLLVGSATMLTGSVAAIVFPIVTALLLPRESAPWRSACALLPAAILPILLLVHFSNSDTPTWLSPANTLIVFPKFIVYGIATVFAAPFVTLHGVFGQMGILGWGNATTAVRVSVVPAALGLGLMAWRVVRGDERERRAILAMLALAGALYGVIALGRAAITLGYSLSLLATRDRYHYDANPPLAIALAVALASWRPKFLVEQSPMAVTVVTVVWVAANGYLARDVARVDRHIWTRGVMDLTDGAIRAVVDTVPGNETVFIRNDRFQADSLIVGMGSRYADLPGIGAYWVMAHGLGPVAGHPIRFVEPDPQRLQAIRAETIPATAALFVGPPAVKMAGATMRTIENDAPREVAAFLAESIDPMFLVDEHDRAEQARRALALRAALE